MISIVIPTFNEVDNIIPLLNNLINLVNDFEYEIVVVDDDSPDGTSEKVEKFINGKTLDVGCGIGDFLKYSNNSVGVDINIYNIPWKKNDHRYLPLIAYRRGAKKIGEIIVRHNNRIYGKSKYSPFKKLIFGFPEVFFFLVRLYYGHYDKKY